MKRDLHVRAIEWESVPTDMAGAVGLTPVQVKKLFGDQAELAVVKCVCVDETGEKVTCVVGGEQFKELVASGEAADPRGMTISRSTWPIVLRGWLQAS